MTTPEETPFPTEQVSVVELRVGDVVHQGGSSPWVIVKEIREIPETSPEWERKLGTHVFVCEASDESGQTRSVIQYAGHGGNRITRRC